MEKYDLFLSVSSSFYQIITANYVPVDSYHNLFPDIAHIRQLLAPRTSIPAPPVWFPHILYFKFYCRDMVCRHLATHRRCPQQFLDIQHTTNRNKHVLSNFYLVSMLYFSNQIKFLANRLWNSFAKIFLKRRIC